MIADLILNLMNELNKITLFYLKIMNQHEYNILWRIYHQSFLGLNNSYIGDKKNLIMSL
jgi:hypothetical protein